MHLIGGISAFELRQNMSLSNTSVPAKSHQIEVNKIWTVFNRYMYLGCIMIMPYLTYDTKCLWWSILALFYPQEKKCNKNKFYHCIVQFLSIFNISSVSLKPVLQPWMIIIKTVRALLSNAKINITLHALESALLVFEWTVLLSNSSVHPHKFLLLCQANSKPALIPWRNKQIIRDDGHCKKCLDLSGCCSFPVNGPFSNSVLVRKFSDLFD